MSTSYYYLKSPFTSLELKQGEVYDTVTAWVDTSCGGMLTVPAGQGKAVASLFADNTKAPVVAYYGGSTNLVENVRGLDPDLTLVSEYGEPITLRDLRKWAGKEAEPAVTKGRRRS